MRVARIILLCLLSLVLFFGCGSKIEKSKKLYDKGVELLQEGKRDEAEDKFKKSIELDPYNSKSLFQLGFMHSGAPDEIEIAIGYLKRGNEVDPENELGHYTLALLYGEKGQIENEVSELQKTLRINNENEGAHYNLGVIYARKRLYDNAIVEFSEVLRINPNETDAMINLGVVYVRSRNIEKASEVETKLKELNKELAANLTKLIEEARKVEEAKEAVEAKKKAEEAKKTKAVQKKKEAEKKEEPKKSEEASHDE